MKRSEQSLNNCWEMEDLYQNDEAWKKEYLQLEEMIPQLLDYKGKLSEVNHLLEFLKKSEDLDKLSERVYVFATQKLHEDTQNAVYQDLSDQASTLLTKMGAAYSFFCPELLSIPKEQFDTIINDERLAVYQTYLTEMYRKKEHTLSDEMEELLANVREVADASNDIFSMFNNADIRFDSIQDENGNQVEVTHGTYISFLENKNRDVRKAAFESMYRQYKKYDNTLAATYRANVKQYHFFAQARKYDNALAYGLDDSQIPVGVYHQLIQTVEQSLPFLQKYIEVRKKALGVEQLHMYDLYVPMVSNVEMKISFEEAKEIVKKGLAPLGAEYLTALQIGYDNRWIDIYENEGKRSGAYSWGAYGTHPYVLLNYQDNLNNVFTLAHEMGHALHSYYSDETQPYVYAGYKIFVAEVASTCNESLLIHYLLENCDDKNEKAYLINHFMEQFRGTLFRQTMFAEFEMITHDMIANGESLTPESLCQVYYDLNKKYFGDNLCIDEEIAMEWARIPHFYRPFYVYQYATGFSAAIAISRKILAGDAEVLNGYHKFLRSGSSMSPIKLLKLAKVDMTKTEPIQEAMILFEELLEEFEQLLND